MKHSYHAHVWEYPLTLLSGAYLLMCHDGKNNKLYLHTVQIE